MPDPAREQHAYLLRFNARIINALRRELAASVEAIVNREMIGVEKLDAITYVRIARAIDAEPLNRMYGAFPGDQNAGLLTATLTSTRLAYVLAFRYAMEIARRHVSARFLRSVRGGSDNGTGQNDRVPRL